MFGIRFGGYGYLEWAGYAFWIVATAELISIQGAFNSFLFFGSFETAISLVHSVYCLSVCSGEIFFSPMLSPVVLPCLLFYLFCLLGHSQILRELLATSSFNSTSAIHWNGYILD